jgi:hypothetical protein
MKVFFIQKNPYCKGYIPQIHDIIRLYNNTYLITSKTDEVYELKDLCSGTIKTYSLQRRPFELIMTNSCKNDICSIKSLSSNIIPNYLQNIPQEPNPPIIKNDNINYSYLSYCSIM